MGAEDRVREDGEKARTLITSALLGELSRRVLEYENAITWNTSCTSCPPDLDSAYAETVRREVAEGKLAEVGLTIAAFLTHYGNSELPMFKVALDLAHGIRQVLDRSEEGDGHA
jgi:hypothetical protein